MSLGLFAWLLTLHETAAGRVYAAYGGVYIVVALGWLWAVDRVRPTGCFMMSDALPVACDMRALSERERKAQMAASVRLMVQERTEPIELPNGYELSFSTAPGRLVELAKWIERESHCCPWIDFALLRPAAGTVQLRLTSSAPDAKAMIAAVLQLAANLAEGAAASPELASPTRSLDVSDYQRIASPGAGEACGGLSIAGLASA